MLDFSYVNNSSSGYSIATSYHNELVEVSKFKAFTTCEKCLYIETGTRLRV